MNWWRALASRIEPRRRFLNAFVRFGFVASGAAIIYPVWRYLQPPPQGEPETASVVAARLAELPPNWGQIFKFGMKPGIVIRTPEGEVRAFSAVCTHLECTVQYRAEVSDIWCACHNGVYDLGGRNVSGPPPRPLERFTVNLRGAPGEEEVAVSRA